MTSTEPTSVTIPIPSIAHLGAGETTQDCLRKVATSLLMGHDVGAYQARDGVADLLSSIADAMDVAPASPAREPGAFDAQIVTCRSCAIPVGEPEATCNGICTPASEFIQWASPDSIAYPHPDCDLHGTKAADQPVSLTAGELTAEHIGREVEFPNPYLTAGEVEPMFADLTMGGLLLEVQHASHGEAKPNTSRVHVYREGREWGGWAYLQHSTPVTLLPVPESGDNR